jgi:hypothetical protein
MVIAAPIAWMTNACGGSKMIQELMQCLNRHIPLLCANSPQSLLPLISANHRSTPYFKAEQC